MDFYAEGFVNRCVERGVHPEDLWKVAQFNRRLGQSPVKAAPAKAAPPPGIDSLKVDNWSTVTMPSEYKPGATFGYFQGGKLRNGSLDKFTAPGGAGGAAVLAHINQKAKEARDAALAATEQRQNARNGVKAPVAAQPPTGAGVDTGVNDGGFDPNAWGPGKVTYK